MSDIRPLWRSALSARVAECQKLQMASQAYMALFISKRKRLSLLGFEWLILSFYYPLVY